MNADLLIIDERLARRCAKRLKFSVTGTVGVLLKAKAKGYIPNIKPLLKELRDSGIRLKDDLVREALELAKEI